MNVGDHRDALRPVKGHAGHAARDFNRDDATWLGQEDFDLRRATVQLDLTDFEAPYIEHRVPRRSLDLKPPRMARIQLDLPMTDSAQAPHLEMLKRRAYSPSQFERLASESPFRTCEISTAGIGLEVRLTKAEAAVA